MSAIRHASFKAGKVSESRAQAQKKYSRRSATKRSWVVVFASFLLAASAAEAQFSVTISGGEVTITGYTGAGGLVAIPATISNLPVTTIGEEAFYGITNVTGVTMSNSVTSIQGEAFSYCALASITLSTNLTTIESEAFAASGLTNITVPGGVTNIGSGAFGGAAKLAAINVDPRNPVYSSVNGVLLSQDHTTLVAFPGTGGSYTIPTNVTAIGSEAFLDSSLTNVIIPTNVTTIGEQAFDGANLTSLTIPGTVTSIEEDAFEQCSSLAEVTISNGLASIGLGAFYACGSLTNITIPASVTSIGLEAFLSCNELQAINVDPQNAFYSSTNGVLFDKKQTTLIECPCAIAGSYTIPAGVKNVETYAFFNCASLTNVTIPASVTNIDNSAFYYCPSLISVFFAGNPPSAASSVFGFDSSATVYYLPGAAGWTSPFGGIPAVLWNPLIEASGVNLGIVSNQFEINITGTTNIPIVLEFCTNLADSVWTPLQSGALNKGLLHYSEPAQTNVPGRFFRIRSP